MATSEFPLSPLSRKDMAEKYNDELANRRYPAGCKCDSGDCDWCRVYFAKPQPPEAVSKLKLDWKSDPCYDLEDADGFEFHYDELLRYRLEQEVAWLKASNSQLRKDIKNYVESFEVLRSYIQNKVTP